LLYAGYYFGLAALAVTIAAGVDWVLRVPPAGEIVGLLVAGLLGLWLPSPAERAQAQELVALKRQLRGTTSPEADRQRRKRDAHSRKYGLDI
jgi:hypothetical protein